MQEFREFMSSLSPKPHKVGLRGARRSSPTEPLLFYSTQIRISAAQLDSAAPFSLSSLLFLSELHSVRTLAAALILPLCPKSSRPVGILILTSYIKTILEFRNLFSPSDFQLCVLPASHSHVYLIFVITSSCRIFSADPSFLTNILPCSSQTLIPGKKNPLVTWLLPRLLMLLCFVFQLHFLPYSASCFINSTTALFSSCFSGWAYLVPSIALSLLAFEIVLFPRVYAFVIWYLYHLYVRLFPHRFVKGILYARKYVSPWGHIGE